tara:strand:+ start:397 stop:981 length:585 start_codon:yes stop_codon:yes gene_type:complete
MKKKILIIGAGGHAKSCIDLILSTKKYKIAGLVDNKKKIGSKVLGIKVIGRDKDLKKIFKNIKYAAIGIGAIKENFLRKKIFKKLKKVGFKIPSIISPVSYVSKFCRVGEGTMVFHKTIINANANVKKCCLINSNALIEHDVTISDFCNISTNVTINGGVHVGSNSFLGSGTIIRENVNIKKDSFIKIGSLLKK